MHVSPLSCTLCISTPFISVHFPSLTQELTSVFTLYPFTSKLRNSTCLPPLFPPPYFHQEEHQGTAGPQLTCLFETLPLPVLKGEKFKGFSSQVCFRLIVISCCCKKKLSLHRHSCITFVKYTTRRKVTFKNRINTT